MIHDSRDIKIMQNKPNSNPKQTQTKPILTAAYIMVSPAIYGRVVMGMAGGK
jgi:hypothetical protein